MAASPSNQNSKHEVMKFDILPSVDDSSLHGNGTLCRTVNSYRHFGQVYRFHLQGQADQEEHLTDNTHMICRNDIALHYYCYI